MSVPIIYIPTFSTEIADYIIEIHHKELPVLITYDITYSDKEYIAYIVFYIFSKHANTFIRIMCWYMESKDLTKILQEIRQNLQIILQKLKDAGIKYILII